MSTNLAVEVSILLIRGYQKMISPYLGRCCRYYPTCSQYAILAMSEWGFWKGGWLAAKRILRCHPWHEGGYDPPPVRKH